MAGVADADGAADPADVAMRLGVSTSPPGWPTTTSVRVAAGASSGRSRSPAYTIRNGTNTPTSTTTVARLRSWLFIGSPSP
jgi:hypothetical protein